jgi:hypothetical protein
VANATSYQLLTSTGGAVSASLPAATTYFTETGLSTNTAYGCEVAAMNSAGSAASAPVTVYTLAAAPANTAITSVSSSTASLGWSANTDPVGTSYEVWYATASGFAAQVSTVAQTTATSLTVASLASHTTYYFRVQAANGAGVATAFGQTVSAETLAVAVDTIPPVISIVWPANGSYVAATSTRALVSYSDSGSGVMRRPCR